MSHPATAGIADRADRFSRLDEPPREPVVARLGSKVITGAHDQDSSALIARGEQPAFHLDSDGALARDGVLRGGLGEHGHGLGAEIVDRTGKYERCALRACGSDAVVQHRHYQRGPMSVSRRVDGMHDDRAAFRRAHYVLGVQRIAPNPGDPFPLLDGLRRPPLQCADIPSGVPQLTRRLAADAAVCAQDQNRIVARHRMSPVLPMEEFWARILPSNSCSRTASRISCAERPTSPCAWYGRAKSCWSPAASARSRWGCTPISAISRSTAHPAASPTWQSIRSSASTKPRPSSAAPAKPWPAGAVKPLRYGRTATSLSSPSSDPVPASAPARYPSPTATTRWYESFRNSSRCRWKPGSPCIKTCATVRAAGSPSMRWSKACSGTSRRRHRGPNVAGYFLLLGAGAFTSMSSFGTPNWPSSLCSLSRSIAPTIFTMVNCRGSLAIKARPVA